MKRTWTIIGVADVSRSSRWYKSLFGQPETDPAHDDFGQVLDTDGTVLLCLHQWGAHEHPPLTSPDHAQPGNGLLLFFRVDDFDDTLLRARAIVGALDEEPHLNPSTGTREFALRDPDGYYVKVSALPSESRIEDLARKHQLHGAQPVLPVGDVAASVGFFRDVLGFEVDFVEGDPPVHGRVKVAGNWGHPVHVHLSLAEPSAVCPCGEIRIHVGRDLDGLFESYRDRGVEVVSAPVSQPWGLREFAVRELNRHVIRFCAEG